MIYGGTIRPGKSCLNNKSLDIVDAFQSYGQYISGQINEQERVDIIKHACPGAGAVRMLRINVQVWWYVHSKFYGDMY
jgi:dihydroxy-acid dehydratase